ncbi:MAG TPA: AMP-binding protein [Candidatus Eremiobacteraceae bacterium]|nr:AMP-binding protein [Candidatus Eremiobacteraceae bacterium]
MATTSTQLDPVGVRDRVMSVIGGLLAELGSHGALETLSTKSYLERDLGLGSLERVELLTRLETAFDLRLPDSLAAQANTPEELIEAIRNAPGAVPGEEEEASALRATLTAQRLQTDTAESILDRAETLLEVIRYRGIHDATRSHLIITEDEEQGARTFTLTFGELATAGQQCAEEIARRGVPPGGRVALMLPTSRQFFVCYAGILLAGAVPVPIYPPFRADRIEEYAERQSAILNNAEVCLLLTFRRAEAVAKLLKPRVKSLLSVVDAQKLLDAAENEPPPAPGALPAFLGGSRVRKGTDIALLQYTSGSTGDPKGVVLTHANLLANMRAISQAVQLSPSDVGVSWLPLYHDMGLIGAWLTLLVHGLPVVVMSPLAFLTRPERWLQAVSKYKATLGAAPNFAFELCVRKIPDKALKGVDLSSWRAALNGAEPVKPETVERFATRFAKYGFRREAMLPVYGLAEASLGVTFPPVYRGPEVDRIEREMFATQGRAAPAPPEDQNAIEFVSAGVALPNHEVMVTDNHGKPVPERTEGLLWFRGPSATSGYYRNPAATEKLFTGGPPVAPGEFPWVNSGDRAYLAGGELYITGRVKDIIIKGGRNLYPHEVEDLASRVDGIRKGCVVAFGLPGEETGTEKLIIVAETRERESSKRAALAAAINDEVSRSLGLPPDRVELIPPGSVPKTSSGKLRRDETKQLYLAGTLSAAKPPAWLQIARLGTASFLKDAAKAIWGALRTALEKIYGVYFFVVFILWIIPACAMVSLYKDHRAAGRFTSAALKLLFALTFIRVKVVGREYMDTPGAKVYASNHASYFDVLPLMMALGVSYRFVAKGEVNKMIFIGTFLNQMGHLSFDRLDTNSRLRQVDEIEQYLQQGDSVFVFPEGTFTPQEGVRPFQLGAFRGAVATGAPVVPVSLAGTRRFLRDRTLLPRPTKVTITLSPPIYPERIVPSGDPNHLQEIVRLRDQTREVIARYSGEPLL